MNMILKKEDIIRNLCKNRSPWEVGYLLDWKVPMADIYKLWREERRRKIIRPRKKAKDGWRPF